MCRLGDMSNRAVGQNQVVADDCVNARTMLVGLVGVPYRRSVSVFGGGGPPGTDLRQLQSRPRQSMRSEG